MAYGDWGAVVMRNGVRLPYRENVLPYVGDDVYGSLSIMKAFSLSDLNRHMHAVLGDGMVRLCGFKSWPILFVDGAQLTDEQMNEYASRDKSWKIATVLKNALYRGIIGDVRFAAAFVRYDDHELVDLCLQENGNIWLARSGYNVGNGHTAYTDAMIADLWNELMIWRY